MTTKPERLFLIDGYAQFFRAYYAIRNPMSSPVTNEPTFMTFGFMDMLLRLLNEYKPDYLAVALDVSGDRGTFRSQLYPEYKANRDPPPSDLRPQVEQCLVVMRSMGIPIYGLEEVEADDVIASIVEEVVHDNASLEVTIVSKDKDLQQLLGPRVSMLNLKKSPDPDERFDPAWLRESKSIAPEQVVDMLALMGDTADNVPGVPGIGPKTAAQLIAANGSIQGVYETIASEEALSASKRSIKGKRLENLLAARDLIPLAQELITLKRDCDVGFDLEATRVDRSAMDHEALVESMRILGFNRLRDVMRTYLEGDTKNAVEDTIPGGLFDGGGELDSHVPVDGEYEVVTTRTAFDAMVALLKTARRLAVDTETDGLKARVVPLAGICLADETDRGWYIPVSAPSDDVVLDQAFVLEGLRGLLEDEALPKFGHNLKFDINVLRNHGIRLAGIAGDTMIESYVVDSTRSSHGMDALCDSVLGRQCVPISAVIGKGKNQKLFSEVPLERSGLYAAEDADVTLRLEDALRPQVDELGLTALYEETELPLVEVLAEMEFNGITVDVAELESQHVELQSECDALRAEIINASPHVFNPDSPKQLAAVLFHALTDDPPGLGLKPIKKGKTGPSTDQEVMARLADDPAIDSIIPTQIVAYRKLTKLINTYLVALKAAIQPSTGRIHASFNQTGTATGRLSSSDPNLQNIPIRTDVGRRIRRAFVAEEGNVLLAADYSQIELRMLAHLANETGLKAAFEAGVDVHRAVAADVFGVEPDAVTSHERTVAKMVNFGIIYGVTPFGLARRLGSDTGVERAAEIIREYKARYSGITAFMEACVGHASEHGYVKTLLGRRRTIRGVEARNPNERSLAERMAINSVVQGSAADLMKIAMVQLYRTLPAAWPDVRMLLQIHDELVFEVPEGEAEAVLEFVKAAMEGAMRLDVPLVVEGSWGRSWADTK